MNVACGLRMAAMAHSLASEVVCSKAKFLRVRSEPRSCAGGFHRRAPAVTAQRNDWSGKINVWHPTN